MAVQRHNLVGAAEALAAVAARDGELVVTHGNGPQVGFLAIEAEVAADIVPAPPLDVLGAESQGQIGYLLAQALLPALRARGDDRDVAVVLTQTVVDRDDPAFAHPTKPVGPTYDEAAAHRMAAERGWSIARDGDRWRRVVPSPRPVRLIEAEPIRRLVETGCLVVAAGGGGVPVADLGGGRLEGLEAVVDKDLAAVVLARAVEADGLLLLTDVDAVYRGFGSPGAEPMASLSLAEAEAGLAEGRWPAGSMGPKVEACASFLRAGGRFAAIGALERAVDILDGRSGTRIE
jgi:carbamate kinase